MSYVFLAEISDSYAESFFEISLLASFSGMTVASQVFVKGEQLDFSSNLLATLFLITVCISVYYLIFKPDLYQLFSAAIAVFFYSIFEIF